MNIESIKSNEEAEFVCLQHLANPATYYKKEISPSSILVQLKEEWFYTRKNNLLFRLLKENLNIDFLHFKDKCKEQTEEYIDNDTLLNLFSGSIHDFQSARDVIRQKYIQRVVDEKITDMRKTIFKSNVGDWKENWIEFLRKLESDRERFKDLDEDFTEDNENLIRFSDRRRLNELLPTRRSIMTIAGHSSHHKTNQLIDILYDALEFNYPTNNNFKVLMFSAEEEFDDIRNRIFARCTGFDCKKIIKREIPSREVLDLVKEKRPYLLTNFKVIDPSEFKTTTDIGRITASFEPDVWGLDYLQYFAQINAGNAQEQNRNVMETSATMKILVEETNSLGIMLAQLRKKEKGALYHFPTVADIEWSGQIVHLSKIIGLCFWAYKIHPEKADKQIFISSWQKVRYGDIFNEWLRVYPETSNFERLNPQLINNYKTYLQW